MASDSTGRLPGRTHEVTWVFYKEFYLDVLENRSKSDSEYSHNVRVVLDRFTRRCGLLMANLKDVSQVHLSNYVSSRKRDEWHKRPLSNKTINNEIRMLNTCLTYAGPRDRHGAGRRYLGWIDDPPWHDSLTEEQKLPRTITPQDFPKLMQAISMARTPHHSICPPWTFWTAAFSLLFLTALRRSALLNIPRPSDEVLRGRRELILPAHLSKTGREQILSLGDADNPASESLVQLLSSLPSKPGEPLLPWRSPKHGRHMTAGYFNGVLRSLQRRAGIPEDERILPKHFRSGSGTAIAAEFSTTIAKKRLGHSPTSNTFEKHYLGRTTAADVEASNYLATLIMPHMQSQPDPQLRVIG